MADRDQSFDFIKGILIFLVVWGHVISMRYDGNHLYNRTFMWIYSFHMPLFILISGYFSVNNINKGFIYTFKKKTARLLLPALVWSGLFLAEVFIKNKNFGLETIVTCFARAWFLYCLYFLYLMASAIWLTKYKIIYAFGIALILYIMYPLWPYGFKQVIYMFQITRQWPIFVLGIVMHEYSILFDTKKYEKYLVGGGILSVAIYSIYVIFGIIEQRERYLYYDNYIWRGAIFLCSSFLWLLVLRFIYHKVAGTKNVIPILRLGETTFGIYMLNITFISFIPNGFHYSWT